MLSNAVTCRKFRPDFGGVGGESSIAIEMGIIPPDVDAGAYAVKGNLSTYGQVKPVIEACQRLRDANQ